MSNSKLMSQESVSNHMRSTKTCGMSIALVADWLRWIFGRTFAASHLECWTFSSAARHNQASHMMLSIKRPTATTVLYTVSTRAHNPTVAARISTLGLLLARVLAGIFVLTLLLNEYRLFFSVPVNSNDGGLLTNLENLLTSSAISHIITLISTHTTPLFRLLISSGILWLIFRKGYTEESLLVIRGLGVQTSTSSPSYLWTSSTRFIPTRNIQDIFIHEAFKGFEVRFYLSIVVEGEENVVVVFPVGGVLGG
jgi:phosphatidylinositol N-acetylglucosaminyltransferase subunit H